MQQPQQQPQGGGGGVYINLTGWRLAYDAGQREYIVYVIKIRLGSFNWTVYRRFTSFRELGERLRSTIPDCHPCPPKRLLGAHSPEFLEQRRLELLDWVRILARDERVCRSPDFHEFLRADANVRALAATGQRRCCTLGAPSPHCTGLSHPHTLTPSTRALLWLALQCTPSLRSHLLAWWM